MDAKEIVKAIIADPEAMQILAKAVLDTPISSLCVATACDLPKGFPDYSLSLEKNGISANPVDHDPR